MRLTMLTLYDLPVSSYGCKIRVVMTHKQLEWRTVLPPDGYGSPAYCKIIPAGTIPAIDQDGFRLADSEAIAEYLDESLPLHPCCPMTPGSVRVSVKSHGFMTPGWSHCFGPTSPKWPQKHAIRLLSPATPSCCKGGWIS